jgi:hypothetical protein
MPSAAITTRGWMPRGGLCSRLPVLAVLAALAGPSTALAQPGNPFSPGIPQSPAQVPTTTAPTIVTTPSTSSSGGGLSGGSAIAIAIGAVVVLTGISFFIWRDARRRAPVRRRAAAATAGAGGRGKPGAKQRGKPRKLSPAERRRRKRGRAR